MLCMNNDSVSMPEVAGNVFLYSSEKLTDPPVVVVDRFIPQLYDLINTNTNKYNTDNVPVQKTDIIIKLYSSTMLTTHLLRRTFYVPYSRG